MNNLKEIFKRYAAVVFFDTETTGLDADTCQIIELAAIRIEQTDHGTLRMANSCDLFVKLPEGQKIPAKIVDLTGITDEKLEAEGVTEAEAAEAFAYMIRNDKGPVLLVAHNAQFDLLFVWAMDNERADLLTYVNVFGYNPKYGVSGRRIDGITYWPQQFNKYMQAPSFTLPARVRRIRK